MKVIYFKKRGALLIPFYLLRDKTLVDGRLLEIVGFPEWEIDM